MLVVAVLASGFAQDSALCASSRTQGDNIWGLVIGWLDLLRVSSIRRCAGIMSRKAYKQGVRAPLLWPRVAGRRAFVPAGCGGYTLLIDIVPHPALLVVGAVSGRRCRLGGGGFPAHVPHAFCVCQQDISDRTRFAFVAELFAAAPV
jgi:hypothetical protein